MRVSTCWDEALPLCESLDILCDIASSVALEGGPEGQIIYNMIKYCQFVGDYTDLLDLELDVASAGWDPLQLYYCRQALAFFQKLEPLEIGLDKAAIAAGKFEESEAACKKTNDLFRAYAAGSVFFRPADVLALEAARRKIARILGPCPNIGQLQLRFGPGATTSLQKRSACATEKMAQGFYCSDNLLHSGYLPELIRSLPAWAEALCAETHVVGPEAEIYEVHTVHLMHGRLEFVPKNAKTYRSIVVEPSLNGMLQAGIGDFMANRLKRYGIDIRNQEPSKALARVGSMDGSLATLDLSSASDMVSRELVKFLLPEDWFSLLNAARTTSVQYQSHTYHLEKFSSMGNGFTFPLETLIFWALTTSAAQAADDVRVYGDDIICRVEHYAKVESLLLHCGFLVNKEKSYASGCFRESCGGDYYFGFDVRPYYQKHLVSGLTLFTLHNFFWRNSEFEFAAKVKSYIPRPIRIYGPDGYGDGHLLSEEYPRRRRPEWVSRGWSGHAFDTFSLVGRKIINRYPGDWVSPLYTVYLKGNSASDSTPPVATVGIEFSPSGRPFWALPGNTGYKRSSIYVLG